MKMANVPQDQDPSFEGGKKLCYALNDDGKFVQVKTSGWNVEAEAKNLAWKAINKDLEATLVKVKNGQASPLEYFMKYRQMDVRLLSQNMEINFFRVWWHLCPQNFIKLKTQLLMRYSSCLKIPLYTLKNFKGE